MDIMTMILFIIGLVLLIAGAEVLVRGASIWLRCLWFGDVGYWVYLVG